jgi:hypothetical protein
VLAVAVQVLVPEDETWTHTLAVSETLPEVPVTRIW